MRLLRPIVFALLVAGAACGEEPLGVSVQGTFSVTGSRSPPANYEPTFAAQGGMGTADLNGNFWGRSVAVVWCLSFFETTIN